MTRRYLPNLIAALVAAVGIVVGSIGPWITVLGLDRSNTDGDGILTLMLGAAAAAMLFAVLNLAEDRVRLKARLCTVCIPLGALAFLVAASDMGEVTSRHAELFGTTITAQPGWGLWLVLLMSVVLVVTAFITTRQIRDVHRSDLPVWPTQVPPAGYRPSGRLP
jgi:hypothetical protein